MHFVVYTSVTWKIHNSIQKKTIRYNLRTPGITIKVLVYFLLAFSLHIDTKLWMQNVPNTLRLHIQEHIAKIILHLALLSQKQTTYNRW